MKSRKQFPWIIMALFISLTWSCSKTEYFKSESKVEEQLKGSWNLIPIPRTSPNETWIFSEGIVYRHKAQGFGTDPVPYDTANYKVKTSMLKVEITIENFRVVLDELDAKWQVVTLNDDFLIIATDRDGSSGILQKEFQKRK